MFAFRDADGPVEIAFTDRHRGIDGGPCMPLDLSTRDPQGPAPAPGMSGSLELVTRALTCGAGEAGNGREPRTVSMHQVHGSDVRVVDEARLRQHDAPVADALVTRVPGVVLVVRVADCVPVLLADREAGVVAAVHAGRPGLVAGVIPEAVRVMRDSGASRIRAWLGPHVCGGCYEVPSSMRDEVCDLVPQAWAQTSWGTPSVDIGAGAAAQLRADDVAVQDVSRCTVEDEDLFSYRRQGTESGRLGGLIWMRP